MIESTPEKTAYSDLACLGSSEVIGLTLAAMRPGVDYTQELIHDAVMSLPGDDPQLKLHERTPILYCSTLSKGGFTVENAANTSYRILKHGELLGKSSVGHLLKLSSDVEPAQAAFIGRNIGYQRKVRPASQNRILLLRKLVEVKGGPISGNDYEELYPRRRYLYTLLESLAASNVICYESSGHKEVVKFLPGPKFAELQAESKHSAARQAVIAALRKAFRENSERTLANADIAEILQLESSFGKGMSTTEVVSDVGKVTNYLRSRGFLAKLNAAPGETGGVKIWLTESQLALASRLVKIFDGLLAPTPKYLKTGRAALDEIMAPENQEVVRRLFRKSMGASAKFQHHQASRDNLHGRIQHFLGTTVDASLQEVYEVLYSADSTISRRTLGDSMRELTKNGILLASRKKNTNGRGHRLRYCLPPRQEAEEKEDSGARKVEEKATTSKIDQPPPEVNVQVGSTRPATHDEKVRFAEMWGRGVNRYALFHYIRRLARSDHDAEDIVSDVLLALITSKLIVPVTGRHQSWVMGIARHKTADYYRTNREYTQSREGLEMTSDDHFSAPAAEIEAEANMQSSELRRLISEVYSELELTPSHRAVFAIELEDPDILSLEGGERLGITADNYRVIRHRIRKKLREAFIARLKDEEAKGFSIPPEFSKYIEKTFGKT